MKKKAPLGTPAPQPPAEAPKRAVSVCVCANGQIIARDALSGTKPTSKLFIPMNLNSDPRLFLKNGELVRPFVTIEFGFQQQIEISGIDMAFYKQVTVAEFDPAGMEPVQVRSLEQDFNELNTAA